MTTKDGLLLRIRVTRDEYERIRLRAREQELSVAGFVRHAVLEENRRLAAEIERLTDDWAEEFVDAVYAHTRSEELKAEVLRLRELLTARGGAGAAVDWRHVAQLSDVELRNFARIAGRVVNSQPNPGSFALRWVAEHRSAEG